MGFFLRKSINFGPLRFNFSKSGVGVSAGVKGARISKGPRGTYIHAGRGGFHYQQRLDSHKTETPQATSAKIGAPPAWKEIAVEIPHGKIIESIKPPKKRALPMIMHVGYVALTIGSILSIVWYGLNRLPHTLDGRNVVGAMLFTIPWIVWIAGVVVHHFAVKAAHVSERHPLYYELDQTSAARFAGIKKSCEALAQTQRIWSLPSLPGRDSYLMHGLTSAWVGRQEPPLISTNVEVWAIAVGNWRMFFLPDSIYVFQNNGYSLLAYETLRISYAERRALEYQGVSPDTQIIDRTWKHTRKDGLPDLRYKVNPMIPIVLYGLINIESSVGWSLALQTSSLNAANQFVNQMNFVIPGSRKQEYKRASGSGQRQNDTKERRSYTSHKTSSPGRSPHEILGVKQDASL
jgi:hypothetical protein